MPHSIEEGDKCHQPGCPGHFIQDTAADGDYLRCDICWLLDDEVE